VDDLTAFLRERLDDAERCVYSEGDPPNGVIAWLTYREPDGSMSYTTVAHGRTADGPWTADGRELPRPASVLVVHDPKRDLREVAAKRAIVALHRINVAKVETAPFDPYTGEPNPDEYELTCETCGWSSDDPTSACATLRALAAVWSDHPDYRPEWRPDAAALPDHGRPREAVPRPPAHRAPLGCGRPLAAHRHQARPLLAGRRAAVIRGAAHHAHRTAPRQLVQDGTMNDMREWISEQAARDSDPSTPPWLTVRMWLAVVGLACSVAALCLI
jgi:hypothetical protein